ncbi:MAG: type II secretion system minor pseudopilin GspK [Nitrospirae bacterium]|nr:type II secretion system minor pseudopilin GspK [Nitrospirota bacterium]
MKKNALTMDHTKSSVCNQRGAALLITLLIVSILTGLAVDFAYEVYIGTSSLSNWSNAQKASLTAKSGQALASNLLKEMKNLPPTSQSEALLPIEKSFGENTIVTVKLEDEEAKFNINSIVFSNGKPDNDALVALQNLLENLKINPDIRLYIADWIDSDSAGGYEDNAKDAPLWSLEELKFIKGIDKEIYDKISPYLTVFGSGKININTAKLPVLYSLVKSEQLAKQIIYLRESEPFKDINNIKIPEINSIVTNIQSKTSQVKFTDKSSNFRVTATATVDEITRAIESVTDTSMNIHFWREG